MNIKLAGLLGIVLLSAGCAATEQGYQPINPKAKNYAEALRSADKSCQVDADCTSVNKGCCLCHGKEAVNKAAAKALQSRWNKECADGVCTVEMCYVELNTSCQNGTCVGTPKPMKDYFAR